MTNQPAPSTHKVTADTAQCCGYGLCAQMCPEVYTLDDNGIVYIENESIPNELLDEAKEGAECCPAQVLSIEEIN
ncbi:MAG: ferredoxin [Arenicella sp.]|jgi:ferredoxin|nr:ferredoxin [Arenicella sp.]